MKALLFFILLFFLASPAFAHCPLCTAATGALVTTARVAGVDDAVVGIFVGAFVISTTFWFNRFLTKRLKRQFPFQPYLLSALFVAVTVASFYPAGLLGTAPDFLYIFGVERLLFGLLLGSIVSIAAFDIHNLLRRFNGHKNHFPLQGIVLPVAFLIVVAATLYLAGVV